MKKKVCLFLALFLAFTLLSVPAYAADTGDLSTRVIITKHPSGETVDEGDTAYFVATADNATAIIWRIVSNDTTNTIQAVNAPDYFEGLTVAGIGEETLCLFNIPASMDGWRVEAMFEGPGGPVYSNGALIRVNGVQLKTPTIAAQPQGASLVSGETTTLSVSAATTTGSLLFQWYINTANSNLNGKPIEGANSASYTPAELTGTSYYYVEVKSAENGRESQPAVSNVVAVSYAAPDAQTPDTQETQTPDTQETPAPLVPVVDTPTDGGDSGEAPAAPRGEGAPSASSSVQRASNALSMLTVVGGVLAVAALAGGITALVLRARGGDDDEDDE